VLPVVAFYHKSRRLKARIRTIWFALTAGMYFFVELDEYVTIRPLFLRAYSYAGLGVFSFSAPHLNTWLTACATPARLPCLCVPSRCR
jgi:hypothetical protein